MNELKKLYRNFKASWRFFRAVNWIKTWYFNYKMFPYKTAKKLPVYFYGKVKFNDLSGSITINGPVKKAMIGFGQDYELMKTSKKTAELTLRGHLIFEGHIQFGKDYFVYVGPKGTLQMGHLSSLGNSGKIICYENITFGTHSRVGFESLLMDSTSHSIINTKTGEVYPKTGKIILGDYNYIGNRTTIYKDTITPPNCIVASNSLCNNDYSAFGEHVLIGGIPVKLLKKNVARDWEGEKELLQNLIVK